MPKFIKVTRSDVDGSYVQPLKDIPGIIEGEFDDLDYMEDGDSITLTVIEMSQEKYDKLPEFTGW